MKRSYAPELVVNSQEYPLILKGSPTDNFVERLKQTLKKNVNLHATRVIKHGF